MRKITQGALALTVAGLGLVLGATATQAAPAACVTTAHGDLAGWDTFGTDATARLTENGVRIATPHRVDRVRWDVPVTGDMVNLSRVTYRTFVHSDGDRGSAAPTVRVYLDTDHDGTADKTLMYEPYWNGTVTEGAWQTWEVVTDEAKLWENSDPTQTVKTWAEWLAALGDSTTVKAVSVSMGTWNEGADARVNNLRIVNRAGCQAHTWALPPVTESPSPTPSTPPTSPTPKPTPTPSAPATTPPTSPTPSPIDTTPPAEGGGGSDATPSAEPTMAAAGNELPLTGPSGIPTLALWGLGAVAAGALLGLLAAIRTRRTRFEA